MTCVHSQFDESDQMLRRAILIQGADETQGQRPLRTEFDAMRGCFSKLRVECCNAICYIAEMSRVMRTQQNPPVSSNKVEVRDLIFFLQRGKNRRSKFR